MLCLLLGATFYSFTGQHKYKYWWFDIIAGLQSFEIMGIAAVGNNLITYVITEMHFSLSKSANIVTNFVGTVFLLALFGGYISDSYLGSFWTMLIFGFVELSVKTSLSLSLSLSLHTCG